MIRRPDISHSAGKAGFTLIEVVLATVIIGIIMLGLHSAMLLAARALPDRANGMTTAVQTSRAMDRLTADLQYATAITSISTTGVTFTVPDRDGDGSPETISYSWSGTSGAPLLRSINNSAAATVATNVTEFALTTTKTSKIRPQTYTESAETLFASNDNVLFLDLADGRVNTTNWYAQYFLPSLPSNATSWRVTRVMIKAKTHGPSAGTTRVQIRTPNALNQPGIVLDEQTMYESTLTSAYAWQTFTYSNAGGMTPGNGAFITLQWDSDADSADVQYQALLALMSNASMYKSATSSALWTLALTQDLIFYVYGTSSTADALITDYYLSSVTVKLRSGSDSKGRIVSDVPILNQPQVAGP